MSLEDMPILYLEAILLRKFPHFLFLHYSQIKSVYVTPFSHCKHDDGMAYILHSFKFRISQFINVFFNFLMSSKAKIHFKNFVHLFVARDKIHPRKSVREQTY